MFIDRCEAVKSNTELIARFLKFSASIINVMMEFSVYNEFKVDLKEISK